MAIGDMSMLRLQQLYASVDGIPLLRDITLDVAAGEVLALIGANGAGKSSLLRAIAGDLQCDSGEISLANRPIAEFTPAELARQLAYLPQRSELNFPFECLDVVLMGRIPHSSGFDVDTQIAHKALRAMDVGHLERRLYTHLSGGERQRIQLARVLSQVWRAEDSPQRLLILDEPCTSLDVAHTQALMRSLRDMAAGGLAIIMVLHDFTLAARYAQRVAAISCGEIAAVGSPEQVITPATMKELFHVDTNILSDPRTGRPVVCIDD